MNKLILTVALTWCSVAALAQLKWTEEDRKYLVDNLIRSRDILKTETENLSEKQWNFKESPDRWSINQVVEHLALWELITNHEISRALESGPQPDRQSPPDSVTMDFITQTRPHNALDFTKPFTYAVPSGLNSGKNNLAWYVTMRNELITFVSTTNDNLRIYFCSYGNLQSHIAVDFGHTDRHLKQITKIKEHKDYPKK